MKSRNSHTRAREYTAYRSKFEDVRSVRTRHSGVQKFNVGGQWRI